MEEKNKIESQEKIEYEEVKHMPLGAFVGIGLAFGLAGGISAGNILFGSVGLGMTIFITLGLVAGFVVGLINKKR